EGGAEGSAFDLDLVRGRGAAGLETQAHAGGGGFAFPQQEAGAEVGDVEAVEFHLVGQPAAFFLRGGDGAFGSGFAVLGEVGPGPGVDLEVQAVDPGAVEFPDAAADSGEAEFGVKAVQLEVADLFFSGAAELPGVDGEAVPAEGGEFAFDADG